VSIWGFRGLPGKITRGPFAGHPRVEIWPGTDNFLKNSSCFKMSDENARKNAKNNQSDGAYLKGCKHGSGSDERMFSAMKYLKNPQRNRLKEQHLTTCARGFKCKESIQSFPFPSAIGKWLYACPKRGRYGVDDDV